MRTAMLWICIHQILKSIAFLVLVILGGTKWEALDFYTAIFEDSSWFAKAIATFIYMHLGK